MRGHIGGSAFDGIVYVHLVCVLVLVYSECVPVSIKQLEGLLTAVVTPPPSLSFSCWCRPVLQN